MAVIFQLWADCENDTELDNLEAHFENLEYQLLSGRRIKFITELCMYEAKGLIVNSFDIGRGYGIENLADTLDATEAGIFLYSHLRTAPNFRFATVGWDVENYSYSFEDLLESVHTQLDGKNYWRKSDCAINDKLFKQLKSPLGFRKFREGYWISRYNGEEYSPLYSDDQNQLRAVCEKLLPDNLEWNY